MGIGVSIARVVIRWPSTAREAGSRATPEEEFGRVPDARIGEDGQPDPPTWRGGPGLNSSDHDFKRRRPELKSSTPPVSRVMALAIEPGSSSGAAVVSISSR